jgi:hypothetical protein
MTSSSLLGKAFGLLTICIFPFLTGCNRQYKKVMDQDSLQNKKIHESIVYEPSANAPTVGAMYPRVEVANVIKVNRYYPERGTSSYADFDRKTWIARLGMATDESADQEVGVLADKLPASLTATISVDGNLQQLNQNSLLGIRVDYQVNGKYTKAILYHGTYQGKDIYNSQRNSPIPWGTKQREDQVIKIEDLSKFKLALKENAPAGWQGQAHISSSCKTQVLEPVLKLS